MQHDRLDTDKLICDGAHESSLELGACAGPRKHRRDHNGMRRVSSRRYASTGTVQQHESKHSDTYSTTSAASILVSLRTPRSYKRGRHHLDHVRTVRSLSLPPPLSAVSSKAAPRRLPLVVPRPSPTSASRSTKTMGLAERERGRACTARSTSRPTRVVETSSCSSVTLRRSSTSRCAATINKLSVNLEAEEVRGSPCAR